MNEMGALGLLGSTLPEKYGCAGTNYTSYGLVAREVERAAVNVRADDWCGQFFLHAGARVVAHRIPQFAVEVGPALKGEPLAREARRPVQREPRTFHAERARTAQRVGERRGPYGFDLRRRRPPQIALGEGLGVFGEGLGHLG